VRPDIIVRPVSPDAFSRPAKRPAYSELLNTKRPLLRDYREALRVVSRNFWRLLEGEYFGVFFVFAIKGLMKNDCEIKKIARGTLIIM
jgi:hypothetical protein